MNKYISPEIINSLIRYSEVNRFDPNSYTEIDYAMEHKTVIFSAGRVSGHSHYIRQKADRNSDLVVVSKHGQKRNFPDHNCVTIGSILLRSIDDGKFTVKKVFVDGLHVFSGIDKEKFYSKFILNESTLFVVLGS